jgi:hypothetical protein
VKSGRAGGVEPGAAAAISAVISTEFGRKLTGEFYLYCSTIYGAVYEKVHYNKG